jgi:hypothetical protein
MVTREELKALIDQLPEPEIEMVRQMLEQLIHPPPPPPPEVERMRQRSRAYKNLVDQRFQETHKPATIGGMGGSGLFGEHEGVPFGPNEFHCWDDKALVHQSLASFDGQEIELKPRGTARTGHLGHPLQIAASTPKADSKSTIGAARAKATVVASSQCSIENSCPLGKWNCTQFSTTVQVNWIRGNDSGHKSTTAKRLAMV